ncbi:MAG: 3'-5' exoribonuclease [Methanocorpusculum sp.]|nr:3'-5' exoribonuclease [Methanocorpusculum sp.]
MSAYTIPAGVTGKCWSISEAQDMQHVVLDLETLSLQPDARVISIGAVGLDAAFQIVNHFYIPLRIEWFANPRYSIDTNTFNWWLKQSEEARAALDIEDGALYSDAAEHFSKWVKANGDPATIKVWGNGPEFDIVILRYLFGDNHTEWPFAYNSAQSIRTIRMLNDTLNLGAVWTEPRVKHHALYDAEAEALFLQDVMKRLLAMDAQISDSMDR